VRAVSVKWERAAQPVDSHAYFASHESRRSRKQQQTHLASVRSPGIRELTVELERERRGTEIAPIRLAPDDLEPDTLGIESFPLREGTDCGVHQTSLGDKKPKRSVSTTCLSVGAGPPSVEPDERRRHTPAQGAYAPTSGQPEQGPS
jgi:hypothetical protein